MIARTSSSDFIRAPLNEWVRAFFAHRQEEQGRKTPAAHSQGNRVLPILSS
jgi:hypothetical protein